MAFIEIRDLNYKTIKNLSVNIDSGIFISVIGHSKTELFNVLNATVPSYKAIKINNTILDKYSLHDINKYTCYLDSDADDNFVANVVINNIMFNSTNSYTQGKIANELIDYFEINDLIYKNPHNLSGGEKQLVNLVSALVLNPSLLIIDDAFNMLDGLMKKRVYSLLKDRVKNGMIVINMTSSVNDILYGDGIIILGDKTTVIKTSDLTDAHQLKSAGYSLPFVLDLSYKLKYYGLINHSYNDISKLVNALWK